MTQRLRFRGAVGLGRIPAGTRASQARFTRLTRQRMAEINKRLDKVVSRYEELSEPALRYGLVTIYNRSQELVPVDTGKLKESGWISVSSRKSDGAIRGVVSYGRMGKPFYAVYVHERLDLYHKPPTQAKFLQRALEERINRVAVRIRNYLAGRVKLRG